MMTVYGRPITQDDMNIIAEYMDDEIRERLHAALAPCTPAEFIRAYVEEDPDFIDFLDTEFDCKDEPEEAPDEYTVFWIGGDKDGQTIATFETERAAIDFAKAYQDEHEAEFDPCWGGVGIANKDRDFIEW